MKYFYTRRNFTIQYKILNFFGPSLSLSPLHNFNLLTQSEAVYEDFIFFSFLSLLLFSSSSFLSCVQFLLTLLVRAFPRVGSGERLQGSELTAR